MSIARYYAWLSRFQDAAGLVAHDTGQQTQTVHRRLHGENGEVSGGVLHERLVRALDATAAPGEAAHEHGRRGLDVLDAGCGLGGTVFALHDRYGGRLLGLTVSPEQCARATAAATRRGVADSCRFVVRDYDAPLADLLPGGVDLVVMIESLAHASDPVTTIERLARVLRPGGRIAIVDDVPRDTLPLEDGDFAGFRAGWLCPAVAGDSTLAQAFAAAGLQVAHDEDLTPRLVARGAMSLWALTAVSRAGWALLRPTPAGVLLGALHGGMRLEQLYRRQLMRYRLIVARRTGTRG